MTDDLLSELFQYFTIFFLHLNNLNGHNVATTTQSLTCYVHCLLIDAIPCSDFSFVNPLLAL